MSRNEYVCPEGYRQDGRKIEELRNVDCRLGLSASSPSSCRGASFDGGAVVAMGGTRVFATVIGPTEAPRSVRRTDVGVVSVEVYVAPYATQDRKPRRKGDRGAVELASALRELLESHIIRERYSHSQICVAVHVLEADGGMRAAAINAVSLAVVDAGISVKGILAACEVCWLAGRVLIDPNAGELQGGGAELTLAVEAHSNNICHLMLVAKVTSAVLDTMIVAAAEACQSLATIFGHMLREQAAPRIMHSVVLREQIAGSAEDETGE